MFPVPRKLPNRKSRREHEGGTGFRSELPVYSIVGEGVFLMQRRIIWTAFLAAAIWARSPGAFADLASYIARPEPQFHWEKSTETQQRFITVTDFKLRP